MNRFNSQTIDTLDKHTFWSGVKGTVQSAAERTFLPPISPDIGMVH